MYIPRHFLETDQKKIARLLDENAFGTLVTSVDNTPTASHIPFLIDENKGKLLLYGHLAYANEQIDQLKTNASAMAIFQGPHTYISPSWYENAGVPTWNYTSVHVYGNVKLIQSDQALKKLVNALTLTYEQAMPSPWQPDYPDKMLNAIVGFKLEVSDIQAKFKLSQNRSAADQQGVIQKLEETGDSNDSQIAALMRENLH